MIRTHARILVFLLAAACRSGSGPSELGPGEPIPQASLRTTSGEIAIGNFEAELASDRRRLDARGGSVAQRASIIERVGFRGRILARIADLEEARRLAEDLVTGNPDDPQARMARAGALAALHRFDEAMSDLEQVESRRGARRATRFARASILTARGRSDEALPLLEPEVERRPDLDSLGALATLRAERGELAEASRLFVAAARAYRDVSPFPIASIEHQRGRMWLRAGDLDRARPLLEAALLR
ncbi:MAG: hypothetical protein ACREQJ_08985, partial [Candidatus Binatia bacterium]